MCLRELATVSRSKLHVSSNVEFGEVDLSGSGSRDASPWSEAAPHAGIGRHMGANSDDRTYQPRVQPTANMTSVKRESLVLFAAVALFPSVSAAEKQPPIPMPESLVLGRHTFIDVGPPFDFYEILSVHRDGTGTAVERITVTPPGDPCALPATVEVAMHLWPPLSPIC